MTIRSTSSRQHFVADPDRHNPKRAQGQAQKPFDFSRLPVPLGNEALAFLNIQELCTVAECSKMLDHRVTSTMPRVWQAAARSFPDVIQWPNFSKLEPKAIKTSVVKAFQRVHWANRALDTYCAPNHRLKREISKFSQRSAKELVCKVEDPLLRFKTHTLPIVTAIDKNSPDPTAKSGALHHTHLNALFHTLGDKCSDDPKGFLNMLFTCRAGDGFAFTHFLTGFNSLLRDPDATDFIPAWKSALEFFAKEGPLPNMQSLQDLFRYFHNGYFNWVHANPRPKLSDIKGCDPYTFTNVMMRFFERDLQISPELTLYTFLRGDLDQEILCNTFLDAFFGGRYTKEFLMQRRENVLTFLGFLTADNNQPVLRDQDRRPFTYFYRVAGLQNPVLMEKIIKWGGRPDNSSTDSNTLSIAIKDKSPLDEISLLASYGARPCQDTFACIEHYSPNADMREALAKLLSQQP